jgi:transglutaminase-like putative cysteine protease
MRRTALAWTVPALAITWNWLRLESPHVELRRALAVTVLGLLAALAPTMLWRLVALLPCAFLAFDAAFGTPDPTAWPGRFERGFLDFYDITLPFGPEHAEMEGVVLLAVFVGSAAVAFLLAARRPAAAAGALVVAAGWPATLLTGSAVVRGAVVLAAALWLLGAGRLGTRALALGAAVVVAALVTTTSPAIARDAVLGWQTWDPYTRPDDPVGVSYVWNSDYTGLHFPKKKTLVLSVKAAAQPHYWRATTLDSYTDDGWVEDLSPATAPDPLTPARAFRRRDEVRQDVTVAALSDIRLAGATTPVAWLSDETRIELATGGVAFVPGRLHRGLQYTVWSWSPRPTPAQLARSRPVYPVQIAELGDGLEVAPGLTVQPFGTAGRDAATRRLLRDPRLADYRPLYERARAVVGDPTGPYAAAVALERWFRVGGGFSYDETPPQPHGLPPLVDFVTRTKAGYCQHFAGSMALMLRYLGIPARVAAGFTQGKRQGDAWKVTDHDAHTWVEVWFAGWGWLPFDPTPGRGTLAGGYTSASAGFNPSSVALILGARASQTAKRLFGAKGLREASIAGEAAKTKNRGVAGALQSPLEHKRDLLLLVLAALAALVAAGVGVKNGLRRLRLRASEPRAIARACRGELLAYLADQGIDAPPGATLEELAQIVHERLSVDAGRFTAAANEARYAPPERALGAAREARVELRRLLRVIRSRLTTSRRLRGALSLRSL